MAIMTIWCFAVALSLLFTMSPDLYALNSGLWICLPNWTSSNVTARVLNSIFMFIFASCIGLIGIFYFLLFAFYVKSNQSMPKSKKDRASIAKEKFLFYKLLTITGVFMVLNSPMLAGILYEFISSKQTPFW